MEDAISAIDLATLLGVQGRTLRRWQANGTGPKLVIEDLKPQYPLGALRKWLRVHRPDVKIGAASPEEKKRKAESALWDDLYKDSEAMHKRDRAYGKACAFDATDPAKADRILLAAGIAPDVVKSRRNHLNWTEENSGKKN
jgi:hypothetical protein